MVKGQELFKLKSNSEKLTIEFGKQLGLVLQAGDVLVLTGDLGAGKTHFTKGVAAALGITEQITSPTFPIVIEYNGGTLPLLHFDLYRLDKSEQLEDIAWYELIESGAVCLVEWGDKFPSELPDTYLELNFTVAKDGSRAITFIAHGKRAQEIILCMQQ